MLLCGNFCRGSRVESHRVFRMGLRMLPGAKAGPTAQPLLRNSMIFSAQGCGFFSISFIFQLRLALNIILVSGIQQHSSQTYKVIPNN